MKVAIISCFETYSIRVNQVEKYFLSRGCTVHKIFSDFSHREKKRIVKENKDSIIYIKVPKYRKNLSFFRLYSHYIFSKKVKNFIEKEKYDLLYVLIPPNSLVKSLLKGNNSKNICIDVIDIWPEAMPIEKYKKFHLFKMWRNYRDKYISNAKFIISECNLFKKQLLLYNDKLSISTIYFYGGEKINIDYRPKHKDSFSFCYIGSINNLLDIDLLYNFFFHLKKNYTIYIEIIGTGEKSQLLIDRLEKLGVIVTYHGSIFNDEKKGEIIRKCDFGINLMKKSTKVGLTMKSIEYLKFGLPLLNNIPEDTWDLVNNYGIGINITSENFKYEIDKMMTIDEEKILELRNNVKRLYNELFSYDNYEKEMDKVFQEVIVNEN